MGLGARSSKSDRVTSPTAAISGFTVNDIGIEQLVDAFAESVPLPRPRATERRVVDPVEPKFTGFVFKIQANMDPAHRDRVAFLRVCSGSYKKGIKMRHVRIGKTVQAANAITFQADERAHVDEA